MEERKINKKAKQSFRSFNVSIGRFELSLNVSISLFLKLRRLLHNSTHNEIN